MITFVLKCKSCGYVTEKAVQGSDWRAFARVLKCGGCGTVGSWEQVLTAPTVIFGKGFKESP